MAADPAEAADALADELADLELDENLVHQATDDDGSTYDDYDDTYAGTTTIQCGTRHPQAGGGTRGGG